MSSSRPAMDGPWSSGRRRVAALAVAVALVYLTWWGIWRAVGYDQDLNVAFAAGRAWLAGGDPYDTASLSDVLRRTGEPELASRIAVDNRLSVYFPPSLPAFASLALLPWDLARPLVIVLNLMSLAFVVCGLTRLLEWRWDETRSWFFAATLLAFAPVHGTLATGQTGLLAAAAIVAGVMLEGQRRPMAAGLMLGLATALKVQIGLPFLAYVLWRRRWITGLSAVALVAALTLFAVVRMQPLASSWATTWLGNLSSLSGPGGMNDPGMGNPERHALVNLQYLLATLISSRPLVDVLTYLLVAIGGLATVWLIRGREPRSELHALSLVAVLGLLVTYHRYYDAVILVFPVAWAVAALRGLDRRAGLAVLVLAATFIVPMQTALVAFERNGIAPAWLVAAPLWDSVLLAVHVWALVGMAVVLLWAAARHRSPAVR